MRERENLEASKCRERVRPYLQGLGLDLGCGRDKILPTALGIDGDTNTGAEMIWDIRDLSCFVDGAFGFVFSSHALEDLEFDEASLREWRRVVRPGGHLVLYVPHGDYYNPRTMGPVYNMAHFREYTEETLTDLIERVGGLNIITMATYPEEYSIECVCRKE